VDQGGKIVASLRAIRKKPGIAPGFPGSENYFCCGCVAGFSAGLVSPWFCCGVEGVVGAGVAVGF
jgi:hypothetical protein